jgi:hypothetical protein
MLPIDTLHLAALIRVPFPPRFLGTHSLSRRIVHVSTDYSKRETSHRPFEQPLGKHTLLGAVLALPSNLCPRSHRLQFPRPSQTDV